MVRLACITQRAFARANMYLNDNAFRIAKQRRAGMRHQKPPRGSAASVASRAQPLPRMVNNRHGIIISRVVDQSTNNRIANNDKRVGERTQRAKNLCARRRNTARRDTRV